MTTLLEKAINRLKQLPIKEQNRFATMVLEDAVWQQTFDETRHELDRLGENVLKEIKAGKFKKIDC